jgi:ABC-type xylose transport system permease subunit
MQTTSPPEQPASPSGPPALVIGAILVTAGLILLVAQLAGFAIGDLGWPLWIVAIGGVLLVLGLTVVSQQGLRTAAPTGVCRRGSGRRMRPGRAARGCVPRSALAG